jgi:antitoxin HicB
MRKDLNYYLKLEYPVEIRKLSKKDGGGFLASIPLLGEKAFRADGRNVKEALRNLRKVKKDLLADYLEEGTRIPEPEPEPDSLFSGKFVVRIRPTLHRQLVEMARKEKVSLNQRVASLLSYNVPLKTVEKKIDEALSKVPTRHFIMPIPQDFFKGYGPFTFSQRSTR